MTILPAPTDALAESQRLIATIEQLRGELPFAEDILALHRPSYWRICGGFRPRCRLGWGLQASGCLKLSGPAPRSKAQSRRPTKARPSAAMRCWITAWRARPTVVCAAKLAVCWSSTTASIWRMNLLICLANVP